jgi:hypothetical protein
MAASCCDGHHLSIADQAADNTCCLRNKEHLGEKAASAPRPGDAGMSVVEALSWLVVGLGLVRWAWTGRLQLASTDAAGEDVGIDGPGAGDRL